MNLLVFGATGRVGRRIVAAALADGHDVTAFVRDPTRLDGDGVAVVQGDVLDEAAVADAVRGRDAVVSALGTPPGSREPVLSEGLANVVRAMATAGVRRLVVVAAAGVLQATPDALRLEAEDFPVFLQGVASQHRAAYETVRESDLDWTLVCPPNMPDRDAVGEYRTELDYLPADGTEIATGDVAAFVCSILNRTDLVGERVGIAY